MTSYRRNVLLTLIVVTFFLAGIGTVYAESTIKIAIANPLSTMDVQKQGNMTDMGMLINIFDMLTMVNKDSELVPWLATEWYAIDDLTWEFKLREDVKFHNGEPFNAEAVKFSLERLLDPETASPIVELRYVTEVRVIDEFTVQIVTAEPDPLVPAKVSLFGGAMVPPNYIREHGDTYFGANPVGTGPFEFVSWQRDGSLVLKANDNYWQGKPKVDRIIVDAIPNDASRIAALLAEEVDIITHLVAESFEQVDNAPNARAISVPGLRLYYLSIDARTGPLANKLVRQAVNLAIDVQTLVDVLLEGHGILEPSLIPAPMFGHNPNIEGYGFDPVRARELLVEAGYPDGFDTTLEATTLDRDVVMAITGMLNNVGINAKPETLESGLFRDRLASDKVSPLFYISNLAWTMDGSNNLQSYVRSDRRYSRMHDPRADELVLIEETAIDAEERLAAFYEIQEILHEGAFFVPLWRPNDVYGVSNNVEWVPPSNRVFWLGDVEVR